MHEHQKEMEEERAFMSNAEKRQFKGEIEKLYCEPVEDGFKINSSIQEIMSHYIDKKEPDTYIFPIILRTENKILEFKDISERRRRYNHYLKDIAKHIGIETNLTSYVARHSWATIAKHKGVPIAAISEGMGHEDVKTTEIYLDSFDKEILDDYNEMITK